MHILLHMLEFVGCWFVVATLAGIVIGRSLKGINSRGTGIRS